MTATATIRCGDRIGLIRPKLHGHFIEHLGSTIYNGIWLGEDSSIPNIGGFRKATVEYQASKVPVLQWPGGCQMERAKHHDRIASIQPRYHYDTIVSLTRTFLMRQLLLTTLLLGSIHLLDAQPVDHRYAPQRHINAICFPGDWLKTVITDRHGLGYDFGPGPYAVPLTEVTLGVQGDTLKLERQYFSDPTIPIAVGEFEGGGLTVLQEAFAVPMPGGTPSANTRARVTRLQGWNGTLGWAATGKDVDPAFRNVAWGVNRPVLYRVAVSPGSAHEVALGILEPYKWGRGLRILDMRVEGAAPLIIDPLEKAKKGEPEVFLFHAADVNNDGQLAIEVHGATTSPDPNCYLNVFWMFPCGTTINTDALIRGELSQQAEIYFDCGREEESWRQEKRLDVLTGAFQGKAAVPEVTVCSGRQFTFDERSGALLTDQRPYVVTRPKAVSAHQENGSWKIALPSGTRRVEVCVLNGSWRMRDLSTFPTIAVARKRAVDFWTRHSNIPRARIIIPDSTLQYILDANARNFYQIAETVDGHHQFQPGPSVYRGLWLHDAAWHMSAALYMGDFKSVREELEGIFSYQLPTGQVRVMAPYPMNRETPLVVYSMYHYARFTNDKNWLKDNWNRLEKGLEWLEHLRGTTMVDPKSKGYGLFPPGFADGGLGGMEYEYGSVCWGLIGFKAGVEAARWLRKDSLAARWEKQYSDLMSSFEHAAQLDFRRDQAGNPYLPMKVGDTSLTTLPQQANWGMLDGQGIGNLFDPHDELVRGTLRMLNRGLVEGLPPSTGWLKDGVWSFFGTLQGIAEIYQRDYAEAHRILYAVANHSTPLGTWVEEQLPRALGNKTTGDGSNATASSLFIKLVRRLIAIERKDTLELLAGIPASWFRPRALLALNDAPTLFGRIDLRLRISDDGKKGTLVITYPKTFSPAPVVISLNCLREAGFQSSFTGELPTTVNIRFGQSYRLQFHKR
jgi:hypothetical protein